VTRPHILFVDDEPSMLSGLRRMLRAQRDRWDLSFANGAAEALETMNTRPADVVVSDFRMPVMDGAGLLQTVRERYPGTARLILSGHTDESDLLKVVLLAHQFVHKPCKEEELVAAIERVLRLRSTMGNADVRRQVSGIEFLPSPPSTLRDLLAAVESEDATPRSVADSLARDPATTAKILQLVNSCSTGLSHRVSDMTHAVSLLGLRNVRSLVLLHDLVHDFNPPVTSRADWVGDLSRHSVEMSRLARMLTEGTPWAEDAFAAGLLVDIGQLVLASCRPDAFSGNYNAWLDGDGPLREIEERTFGVDHAAAGAYLLGLWGLPFPVIEAVARHTEPAETFDASELVPAVRLAHRVVELELGAVCSTCGAVPPLDENRLDQATRERITRWREHLHRERTDADDD
jgi:HD-like signal output (HDOD) protein/CheY-like chemotaxis protein